MRKVVLILLVVCAAGLAWSKPPEEKLAPFKEQLEKTIKVKLVEDSLEDALNVFARYSDVPLVIDYKSLALKMKDKITIRGDLIPIRNFLDLICDMAGVDYDIRNGMFFISTPAEVYRPYIRTRRFDVRGMTVQHQDMPGPNIELVSGEADISISSMDAGDFAMDEDGLAAYIRMTIMPEIWNLAEVGVGIDVQGGILVISAPEYVFSDVEKLLDEQRKHLGKMVTADSRFCVIKRSVLKKLYGGGAMFNAILSAEQADAAFEMIDSADEGITVLADSSTICFNNQRNHTMGVGQASYVRDITPVVAEDSAAADPEVDTYSTGSVFDWRPTISYDEAYIYLEMRPTLAELGAMEENLVPIGVTEPVGMKDDTDTNQQIKPAMAEAGKAHIQLPEISIIRFRTNARIPNGGAVLLRAGGDSLKNPKLASDETVVFILRAVVTK